jgi:chromosome segregation ATPase
VQELESSAALLRDALGASRIQVEQLRRDAPSAGVARKGSGVAPMRLQEELELATTECAALREEATELESEVRGLRASLEEHESTQHAQTAVHKQLSRAFHEAQTAIKALTADNAAASSESQRLRVVIEEGESGRAQLAAQIESLEQRNAESTELIQRANVSYLRFFSDMDAESVYSPSF